MAGAAASLRPADAGSIAAAAALLRAGRLVALPTETVYGLGGNARDEAAVAAIFAAKGRPTFNPLIVHVPDLAGAEAIARFSPAALRLAARFWPGPLTLVLPRRPGAGLSRLVSAGLDSVALRVPAHPVAQAVLRACGLPVAAPSANRSGRLSPTRAAHVAESLGESLGERVALILDGGACPVGVESTVIDLTGEAPALLRPGGLPGAVVEAVLEVSLRRAADDQDAPRSPGQLLAHYAPGRPLRLNAPAAAGPHEALLGFGPAATAAGAVLNLSQRGDSVEAAANLFAMLHALDCPPWQAIAAMTVPDDAPGGLGPAINDRLRRAAATAAG